LNTLSPNGDKEKNKLKDTAKRAISPAILGEKKIIGIKYEKRLVMEKFLDKIQGSAFIMRPV